MGPRMTEGAVSATVACAYAANEAKTNHAAATHLRKIMSRPCWPKQDPSPIFADVPVKRKAKRRSSLHQELRSQASRGMCIAVLSDSGRKPTLP